MPHIIDSHLHFWDRERFRYPWLDDEPAPLGLSHVPSDLAATGWAADSIVAFAPLDVPAHLETQLAALAELPLVVGVRRLLQDANPGLATSPEFVAGVRSLADHDYAMDLCIRHFQLPEVTLLVERCPEVRFVLDHLGKPSVQPGDFAAWAADLARLAALPNVVDHRHVQHHGRFR